MLDIRVLSAYTVIPFHSVAPIRGFLPHSIMVSGDRFDKTSLVVYNGEEVKEFFVQSPSRMIVRIPESQLGKDISNMQVLSVVPISGINSVLTFEVPKPIISISGIDRLVQNWVMTFMTTPGSDIFDLSSGGGGKSLVGMNTGNDGNSVRIALVQAIIRTTAEIKSKQAGDSRIPFSERLLDADLENVTFDERASTLSARVSITNTVGESGQVKVG